MHPYSKTKTFLTLLGVGIVLIGIFLAYDLPARARFTTTYNEVEKIRRDVMNPAGAMERNDKLYKADVRGDGIIDLVFGCGSDVACPTIGRVWFTPIEPGKEADFLKLILQNNGYRIADKLPENCTTGHWCGVSGEKEHFRIGIDISQNESNAPTTDVSPKKWRAVDIRVSYR